MRRLPIARFLVLATAVAGVACGGRTELDGEDDVGVAPPPGRNADAGTVQQLDAGLHFFPDGAVVIVETDGAVVPPDDACVAEMSGPASPECVPTSTCGVTYFPPGYARATGPYNLETITVACKTTPTIVQQWVDGGWVSLEPFVGNGANFPSTPGLVFDTGYQWPLNYPPSAADVGSIQAIRACSYSFPPVGPCTTPSSGITCDPPTNVVLGNCGSCAPTVCGGGKHLDQECACAPDVCPCPRDPYPACPTPTYQCFSGG